MARKYDEIKWLANEAQNEYNALKRDSERQGDISTDNYEKGESANISEKAYELKNNNRDDDLFKYLLITQCNALSGIFPKMFQKIAAYTELLLPDYLLRDGSVIEQMVNQKDGIPEVDWQDQVQIIGWLYQY